MYHGIHMLKRFQIAYSIAERQCFNLNDIKHSDNFIDVY